MSDTETVNTEVTVERPYSYWEIERLDIWSWVNAVFNNYSLPNGVATAPDRTDLQHD